MCFACVSQFRPRYKRLVDDIFPIVPEDGLLKNNMEKLTFYALSSPEKLDRIGEYLYQRACRDITRKRHNVVKIAMEAMDQLLMACHSQNLNLFVESFLRMVQKLLESHEPELWILATQSFIRFANIEEDTPSYHRRYDFFVSKFSSMCFSNISDLKLKSRICLAGIRGLQGVIRKTVSDDLVENIWEPIHMDKIVPSLLYNMHVLKWNEEDCVSETIDIADLDEIDPPALAESCLRELIGRASFGHVKSIIRPVLWHFDLHDLWISKSFAIHCFRVIMFSIQSQYLYTVVESLMTHLDQNSKSPPKIRTSIADVLSKIIAIAAGESVGPTVLEIINSLLTHLRKSVIRQCCGIANEMDDDESNYQDALISALGEFAANLPDYQKIEIMMFIMSKITHKKGTTYSVSGTDGLNGFRSRGQHLNVEIRVQRIFLRSLLMVSTKYNPTHMTATLPQSFLDPLLRSSKSSDPEIRILVQHILHTLLDRHGQGFNFSKMSLDAHEIVAFEKCSRSDTIFMRKNGPEIYTSLYESLDHDNNTIENVEAVYKTMALLCLELTSEETILDYFRMVLSIQELALSKPTLPKIFKYQMHSAAICLLMLGSQVHAIETLIKYANKIVNDRRDSKAYHLLPNAEENHHVVSENSLPDGVLLEQCVVIHCLDEACIDTTKMTAAKGTAQLTRNHSWIDNNIICSMIDTNISTDIDSASSSPCSERKFKEEDLSFEAMKQVLHDGRDKTHEQNAFHNSTIFQNFKSLPFEELVRLYTRKEEDCIAYKLNELFAKLNAENASKVPTTTTTTAAAFAEGDPFPSLTAHKKLFPELFA